MLIWSTFYKIITVFTILLRASGYKTIGVKISRGVAFHKLRSKMSASTGSGTIKPRCIIVPGCGCSPISSANWYKWMHEKLIDSNAFSEVLLEDMPDPDDAKESIWLPFIINKLKADSNTVMIGHSSGAVAAMRLLENNKLKGCVLVSACHSDGGVESERLAGYYNRPWKWDAIKSNAEWILQYHSSDDHLIPIAEADLVASKLNSEYFTFDDKSHFFAPRDIESSNMVADILGKLL